MKNQRISMDGNRVARMYESGKTISEIADELGVSRSPVARTLREMGVSTRSAAPRAETMSGNANPQWRGGRRTRTDGYVLVWTENGERLEHRVIMEDMIGRRLNRGEVVHHKDGDPSNNSSGNLELVASQSDHALSHGDANRRTLLENGIKMCTMCLIVKPLSQFYKTKHNKMGVQSWCKTCKNNRDSERRKKSRSSFQET